MQSKEAYEKIEKAVLEIDPTGSELADLIIDVLDNHYLLISSVRFYDQVDNRLWLKVVREKYRISKKLDTPFRFIVYNSKIHICFDFEIFDSSILFCKSKNASIMNDH